MSLDLDSLMMVFYLKLYQICFISEDVVCWRVDLWLSHFPSRLYNPASALGLDDGIPEGSDEEKNGIWIQYMDKWNVARLANNVPGYNLMFGKNLMLVIEVLKWQ